MKLVSHAERKRMHRKIRGLEQLRFDIDSLIYSGKYIERSPKKMLKEIGKLIKKNVEEYPTEF